MGGGKVFRQNEDSIEKESNKKNAENSEDTAKDFSAIGFGVAKGAQGASD